MIRLEYFYQLLLYKRIVLSYLPFSVNFNLPRHKMKSLIVFCLCFGLISALHLDTTYLRLIKKRLRIQQLGGRIIGGNEADIEKHPYQLGFYDTNQFFCGGVIISDRWALTAAHCVEDNPPTGAISFRAGHADHSQGRNIRILSYDIHEKYDEVNLSNDVAVVLFLETLKFDEKIQSIPIAARLFDPAHGSDATVSGWGYMNNGQLAKNLQAVTVPVVNQDACEVQWPGWLDNSMICAGDKGRDSCKIFLKFYS